MGILACSCLKSVFQELFRCLPLFLRYGNASQLLKSESIFWLRRQNILVQSDSFVDMSPPSLEYSLDQSQFRRLGFK